jgi:hypothetical protein
VAASSQAGIPGKGVFWGTMLGGSLYRYNNDSYSDNSYGYSEEIDGGAGFNFDFFLGYDFGLLAGQVEFLLTGDKGNLDTYSTYYEFSGTTIQIPIMLKLDLHGSRFMFQPQAGLYFNIEVGKMDYEMEYYQSSYRYVTYEGSVEYDHPLMGVMVGWALGVRIGRGYLFTDFRYATNLGETELDNMGKYHRSAFMFNLGYQYYFKGKQ